MKRFAFCPLSIHITKMNRTSVGHQMREGREREMRDERQTVMIGRYRLKENKQLYITVLYCLLTFGIVLKTILSSPCLNCVSVSMVSL